MQKTAAQQAYARFLKAAQEEASPDYPWGMIDEQALQELLQQQELNDFQDPNYESPLERKRKMQGTGASIGSGAGLLGGALAGATMPSSAVGKVVGGLGGGLGGLALGGLGGWGAGTLAAKARMGEEYPKG